MITLVALVAVALLQGWLMQTAVALTGDPAPRFSRALGAGLFALITYNITTFAMKWTVGFFMGSWLTSGLGLGLGLLFAGLVVMRRLQFSFGHALTIAAIHLLFAHGAQIAVNWLVHAIVG